MFLAEYLQKGTLINCQFCSKKTEHVSGIKIDRGGIYQAILCEECESIFILDFDTNPFEPIQESLNLIIDNLDIDTTNKDEYPY